MPSMDTEFNRSTKKKSERANTQNKYEAKTQAVAPPTTGSRYKQSAQPVKPQKKNFFTKVFPQKGDQKAEIVSKLIFIISFLAIIVCLVILGKYCYELIEAKQDHITIKSVYELARADDLENSTNDTNSSNTNTTSTNTATINAQENDENPVNVEDNSDMTEMVREPLVTLSSAQAMIDINSDYAGFLKIDGVLEEAVVQYTDNSYYLDHNFYNEQRQCGVVFIDYRCNANDYDDLRSDNIVLYGHNQKDGTMFGNMDYYKNNYSYWKQQPFIYFNTKYAEETYVIISSFVTNADAKDDNGNVFDYWDYINFNDKYSFEEFSSEITKRSNFNTGIEFDITDKYLTLSTCSTEWDSARHAIIARRLRDNETEESIDIMNFSINQNSKWPAIYYKYHGGSYIE